MSLYPPGHALYVPRYTGEQLAGTVPLPKQRDRISLLPEDIGALLQTLKAAQQGCEQWLESETCLRILKKYRNRPRTQPTSPATNN